MRKPVLSLAIVFVGAAVALAGSGKYNKKVGPGDKAPAFDGIPAIMDGEAASLTLGDIKEDVVVIGFLANHCPVVINYEDRVIDLANAYKGKSVKFVGIAVSGQGTRDKDDIPAIKSHTKEKGYNFVYGFDATQETGKAYGATNTPQFFVLDKDRVIRYTGALDDNQNETKVKKTYLKNAIDAVLAGKELSEDERETRAVGCGISYDKK